MKHFTALALIATSLIAAPARAEGGLDDNTFKGAGYLSVYAVRCDATLPRITQAVIVLHAENNRAKVFSYMDEAQALHDKHGKDIFCFALKATFAKLL